MARLTGQKYCFTHSATAAGHRRAARVKGGRATRTAKAAGPVPVATIAELQMQVGQVLADALLRPNTESRAAAVARLVAEARKLIEAGETESRLQLIEERLRRMEHTR